MQQICVRLSLNQFINLICTHKIKITLLTQPFKICKTQIFIRNQNMFKISTRTTIEKTSKKPTIKKISENIHTFLFYKHFDLFVSTNNCFCKPKNLGPFHLPPSKINSFVAKKIHIKMSLRMNKLQIIQLAINRLIKFIGQSESKKSAAIFTINIQHMCYKTVLHSNHTKLNLLLNLLLYQTQAVSNTIKQYAISTVVVQLFLRNANIVYQLRCQNQFKIFTSTFTQTLTYMQIQRIHFKIQGFFSNNFWEL
eukprot:TRINITY_DN520_c0_g1_i2.p1 TRINITY_DN520_c0_g1~~TRINITY_DN520_c0_g1_i2.p1  ORF type:complete len:252 (+),score=-29.33 TRINITY_DN520_c0_g1_i2:541-1296(+)